MERLSIYYFSGTHWDREWYQSFQGFRYRLVNMITELVEYMETEENYKTFHFDGQTIFLEDYAEIEPEGVQRLKELISKGRIVIGPWYVMPDEFLLSGESLIRNLMLGHKLSKKWGGKPWKYGYICDIFGHISQMPQIFNGFDINYAFLGRGTNEHNCPAHFIWQAPNGSNCITYKVPDSNGYGAFRIEVIKNDNTTEGIKRYIEHEITRTDLPFVVIADAMDHTSVYKQTPVCIEKIKELYPDASVYHANLLDMGRALENYKDRMPVKKGELNETGKMKAGYIHLITHTLSSRYPLKKENDHCQALLEKWVEPLVAISEIENAPLNSNFVDLAYKYLIQNHPHDSICGCSIDQVHRDMIFRFDQTKMLCEQLISDFLSRELEIEQVDGSHTRVVTIWNSLPFMRNETVTIDVNFDRNYICQYAQPFGYENINSFKIFDVDGIEKPYSIAAIQKNQLIRICDQECKTVDIYKVTFEANLPPMGKAQYKIVPSENPVRYLQALSKEENQAENEFLILEIANNGTITITDKRTGNKYTELISYLDDGEIGDGWFHANPACDRTFSSISVPCTIETFETGCNRIVYKITQTMNIPEKIEKTAEGIRRSDRLVGIKMQSFIGLSKGAEYVDVKTIIENNAKDHRIRLKLPTNIKSGTFFAGQPFCVVERPIGINPETADWKECALEKQTNGIVFKRDKNGNGLAFISTGLHECAGHDDNCESLLITLFRSFGKTVLTNGELDGQLQGEQSFEYRLMPINNQMVYADFVRAQDCLAAGLKAIDCSVSKEYKLKKPQGYFELDSKDICLSILKRTESREDNSYVIRLYNMSDKNAIGKLNCSKKINEVSQLNMNEEFIRKINAKANTINLDLGKWEIVTLKVKQFGGDTLFV